jgi:hypothetical protein
MPPKKAKDLYIGEHKLNPCPPHLDEEAWVRLNQKELETNGCILYLPAFSNLVDAIEAGDLEQLKFEIEEQGADPQAKDSGGVDSNIVLKATNRYLPWFLRTLEDVPYPKALENWLKYGLTAPSLDGRTLLHHATKPIVTKRTPGPHSPLATTKEIIEYLLDKGVEPNAKDERGNTPLHHACVHGNLEAMDTLIKHGSEINAKDNKGRSPLWYAILSNEPKAVKLLLKLKADFSIISKDGESLMYVACFPFKKDTEEGFAKREEIIERIAKEYTIEELEEMKPNILLKPAWKTIEKCIKEKRFAKKVKGDQGICI